MLHWRRNISIFCLGLRALNAMEDNQQMIVEPHTIGVIGGVSWESTLLYYTLINRSIREELGALNSAKILLYSLNYEPIVQLEREGKWDDVRDELVRTAKTLQEGGAQFIILCCNTLHKVASSIEEAIAIPFLHIADPSGNALVDHNIQKVGLLGTQFTMEEGFYSNRLREKFGLEVLLPRECDRRDLDAIIYEELCQGKILTSSRERVLRIIGDLKRQGAQAILLGCTELGMLLTDEKEEIPFFDTTALHAQEAVNRSLNK